MKNCRVCNTQNPDEANLCTGCAAPLTAFAAEAEVQHVLKLEEAQKKARRLRTTGLALLVLAAGGAWMWRNRQKQAEQAQVAQFYLSVRQVYDQNVVEFWKCLTRGGRVPENNLELTEAIEGAFRKAPKSYLAHLRDRCLPMALSAPRNLRAVPTSESVGAQMESYAASLEGVAEAAQAFANDLGRMAENAELDAKVIALANNYHYSESDSQETYAYDQFLRCAVPGFADMNEMQQALEFLAQIMKDPAGHVARWRKECAPPLLDTSKATAHADYKNKLEKFSADARDISAFSDCFKKADEAARQKLLAPLEKAWFASAQAWEALKANMKTVLGELK